MVDFPNESEPSILLSLDSINDPELFEGLTHARSIKEMDVSSPS